MKARKLILALLLPLAATMTVGARSVTMTKAQLIDKIKGGWAGQTIGVAYGGPVEFRYQGKTIPDSVKIEWSAERPNWYFDNGPGLYDDLYMDLTFVNVFDKKGLDAPASEFAKAFAGAEYPLWHANQSGRYNIQQGVMPPESGYWKNNPHADDIDFQIEADFSGLMAPGMPNSAIRLGDAVGHMMNYGDGWYGGVMVGAMYALAFVSSDVNYVVSTALRAIPQQSKYYKCMADVIAWHKQFPTDWRKTWQLVQDKYGTTDLCPEGYGGTLNIDAVINSAYVVIGLLYGQGDFGKTIDIAARCGQDADCNPSTAGGILGTMLGYDKIPDEWRKGAEMVIDRPFVYTDISINKATEMSCKQALEVIKRGGGKVTDKKVVIKVQQPQAVRFEKCYDGLEATERRSLGSKPIDKAGEIHFTGCGFVVRGSISADDQAYAAQMDVIVDGKKVKAMSLPANYHDRSNDLCWYFDLAEGEHVLTFKRTNPQDNVRSSVDEIIVFRKAK